MYLNLKKNLEQPLIFQFLKYQTKFRQILINLEQMQFKQNLEHISTHGGQQQKWHAGWITKKAY
jgi:hypothetical protein